MARFVTKKKVRQTTRLRPHAKVHVDPHTGKEYLSPSLMKRDQRLRKTLILNNFAQMVAEDTLGQSAWERLPGEDEAQYHRFRTYLSQATRPRSLPKLCEALCCPLTNTKATYKKWHWALRSQLWDREMDRQADEAFAEQKRIAGRRQAKLGARLQEAADRGLNVLLTGAIDMTPNDVVRLADAGVRIERLAHDKSTTNEAKEVRFVFEGARPKWAEHDEDVVEALQVEAQSS